VRRRIIICNREKERELQQHVEVLFFGKCTEGKLMVRAIWYAFNPDVCSNN
jgi:hypothetical protein